MEKEIRVGIADLNFGQTPEKLITVGLGSCIGIALYDSKTKIGGLAHIMLPDSNSFNNITNKYKFADLAIPILIDKMVKIGAIKANLRAKIAGGASMFKFSDKSMIMDIGNRNIKSVKKVLSDLNIPIISEDTGGNKGRTIIFYTENGDLKVKVVGAGEKFI